MFGVMAFAVIVVFMMLVMLTIVAVAVMIRDAWRRHRPCEKW
jgi:heme/copper-type cytochrome/quinol oxidase subunit 4